MQAEATKKLEALRADFNEVVGRPFSHFFCPVLFRDEDSPLCQAHIVNAAFPETSRQWTLQRQDVDNFYGSIFESDFVDLRYAGDGVAAETLVDSHMYKRFRPKILRNGREVEYFFVNGPVPSQFTKIVFEEGGHRVLLALKLAPSEVSATVAANWQIEVVKDIRLAAIVSVLKAAHLTLFEMLGYRYALGLGGRYLGGILGQFFLQSVGRTRAEAINHAATYFEPFAAMVRPVVAGSPELGGSIDDSAVRVCWCEGNSSFWGIVVFVRTHRLVHAALLPVFEDAVGAKRFERFMESNEDTLDTSLARFENGHWDVSSQHTTSTWPAADLSEVGAV